MAPGSAPAEVHAPHVPVSGVRKADMPPRRDELPVQDICDALERTYRSPRHGNKDNPLDELVYIILSTRTRDQSFAETYRQVKRAFPRWDDLRQRHRSRLEGLLVPGGLGRLKAGQLLAITERLRSEFGHATLAPLKRMDDREAEAFLTSLPGVAAKIAKCVLMYSLGRQVLPVDVHVHRVASRLGFAVKKRPDTSQELIEGAVPPPLRYGFHVNAVAHGRAVCLPRSPRCSACCVSAWCSYYRSRTKVAT